MFDKKVIFFMYMLSIKPRNKILCHHTELISIINNILYNMRKSLK